MKILQEASLKLHNKSQNFNKYKSDKEQELAEREQKLEQLEQQHQKTSSHQDEFVHSRVMDDQQHEINKG